MKTYTQNILQVLFICGVIGFFALWQRSSNAWDFIVYTQQWPEAACVDINVSINFSQLCGLDTCGLDVGPKVLQFFQHFLKVSENKAFLLRQLHKALHH